MLTARDHAQTSRSPSSAWPEVVVIGGESPAGRVRKARLDRSPARPALWRFARRQRPDVALSHGSYAQVVAARPARVPAVTMMDYEHQPANHLSFRLARRVIVPATFPEASLRRFRGVSEEGRSLPGLQGGAVPGGASRPDPSILDIAGPRPRRASRLRCARRRRELSTTATATRGSTTILEHVLARGRPGRAPAPNRGAGSPVPAAGRRRPRAPGRRERRCSQRSTSRSAPGER